MTEKTIYQLAAAFLREYTDPEIDKRLFFDVWSDRSGHGAEVKRELWMAVKRLTRRRPRRGSTARVPLREPPRSAPTARHAVS